MSILSEIVRGFDPGFKKLDSYLGSLNVWKVELDKNVYVLKFLPAVSGPIRQWQEEHLANEERLLKVAQGIEGITHLVRSYRTENQHALLKEYFDGEDLSWEKVKEIYLQKRIVQIVNDLHYVGIAGLDLFQTTSKGSRNIVVAFDRKDARVIELGSAILKNDVGELKFEQKRKIDLEDLEYNFE